MNSRTNWKTDSTLIFTDLDGSLLDHHDYSFTPAIGLLEKLEACHIPVICCTSKTFAELLPLREALHNKHPFVVENGAAVYIPNNYFPHEIKPDSAEQAQRNGYQRYAFSEPREHWLNILNQLDDGFAADFNSFSQLGAQGIAALTDLSVPEAQRANAREFSEPVQWLGSKEKKQQFIQTLKQQRALVLQGGRFLHISGNCNKGRALQWLTSAYQQQTKQHYQCIAIGDSGNDIAMLEAADQAILIRSPAHDFPIVKGKQLPIKTTVYGPEGWAQGVNQILQLM